MGEKAGNSWMYSGPESVVDREKYLLGAKVDKNFELFGADKPRDPGARGGIDAVLSSAARAPERIVTELELETVKKEDPLVAIKVREAKARQELLNNPVKMKKLQNLVLDTMAKKLKKAAKKEAKRAKKEKKRRHDSSDDEDRERQRRRRSPSPRRSDSGKRHRSRSPREDRRRRRSPSPRSARREETERRRPRHDSSDDERSERRREKRQEPNPRKRRSDDDDHSRQKDKAAAKPVKQEPSSDSSSSDDDGETSGKPMPGPSLPEPAYDSDEEERRAKAAKFAGFGLVAKDGSKPDLKSIPVSLPDFKDLDRKKLEPKRERFNKEHGGVKLSEEEKERRRKEMMDNANWRDSQRNANLQRYKAMEEAEATAEAESRRSGSGFVRGVAAAAVASGDLASRLASKRGKLQRPANEAASSSFARK